MYDLSCDFDLQKHKETYINYLEVVILPTGKIEYAIPSHCEKLISIAMSKYGKTRKEVCDMCPPEYWFDCLKWLTEITGCVSVCNDYIVGKPNKFQKHKLDILKKEGLCNWQEVH